MKFSIVIPVYNTEKYLPRCLNSLRGQTAQDFEVVIVDDCSPGNCAEVVRPYGDFVLYVRHDRNRGAFWARCTGVAAAKGDYIVPVDPDDYLAPETLAKLRETIERESPDVVSYWIDCYDGRKRWPHWCRHPAGTDSVKTVLQEMLEHKTMYSIVSKVVRRDIYQHAVKALCLPPDAYVNASEDFLATMAILLCSQRVAHLDYAGYRYFKNPESITAERRTSDGLRRACEQTRFVHDTVRAMALRETADAEVRRFVDDIILQSERWFCTEVMEGPARQVKELADILLESFHPDNVCRAFVEGYTAMVGSRAYRLGKGVAQCFRRLGVVR